MEAIFINSFKQTKENYIEMNKKHSAFSIYFLGALIFIIYTALTLIYYYVSYDVIISVILALIGVLFPIYPHLRINIIARKREKIFIELYEKIPEGQTLFFDDHIFSFSETDKAEVNIDYKKIKKIKQSKNLYLLILNKKIIIMVDKRSFEKGTCEEFEKFIAEKAVNAKIKL